MENDLGFIPDLPRGPLDLYRSKASFDWKLLKLALEGHLEMLKLKYKVWKALEEDSMFAHSTTTPSVEEQKRITQLRVNRIIELNMRPANLRQSDYKTTTRAVMTINEAVQALNPNVSVKMAIGMHLFGNTLLSLGTERHLKLYEAVFNGEVLSCCALTEIAHGSDTRNMRTTATYDPTRQEFVIHTPDFEAAKCWVGNLGRTCTYALVFAKLITHDGTNHGLHAFVVPVRNPNTLETYPGLIIGDMGEKIGVNGIDNGFMMFDNYRIPRENLLNRTADVTPEGEFESCFSDPSKMLGAALENLSAGRLGIMQESCHTISSAVTIALRYAATRKQFRDTNGETPLLDYELHRWRLFGYMAAAALFKVYIHTFTDIYLETIMRSNLGDKIENLSEMVSEIHAIVSCSKPLITWTTGSAIQECREACGGHGFLKCANLGELRNNHDPCVTYEGDNNVLSQQTTNWLIRQLTAVERGGSVDSPFGTVQFLNKYQDVLKRRFSQKNSDELKSVQFILMSYEWLICWLLVETRNEFENEKAKGLTQFEARNRSQVYKSRDLSRVYAEYLCLTFTLKGIEHIDGSCKKIMERLFIMYGLWSLDKSLIVFYEGGFSSKETGMGRLLHRAILEMCDDLKYESVSIADSLAPTDFVLNSVLGKSDGKLYQNLQKELFHNPGAFERASWWQQIAPKPKSKL